MKTMEVGKWVRILLALCGVLLIVLLFFPMWRIDLDAPQYPEGLTLLIYPDKIAGDVGIVNGLNHYIGMKTLHTSDFFEFTILTWIVAGFSLLFFLTAITANRKLLFTLTFLFVTFGIVAMADFWRWEYNYGHNLNPDAAIVVPGMACQPPLIGFKQLLNFGAYSIPATGGWLFAITGLIVVACAFIEFRRKPMKKAAALSLFIPLIMTLMLSSCNKGPEPILVGKDACSFCKMTISDMRFGAEVVTPKGKVYKFDDIQCLFGSMKDPEGIGADAGKIYLTNYCRPHELLDAKAAMILRSQELACPMGGDMAAFGNNDSLMSAVGFYHGTGMSWDELLNERNRK